MEESKRITGHAKTQTGHGRRKTSRPHRARLSLLLEASAQVECTQDCLARGQFGAQLNLEIDGGDELVSNIKKSGMNILAMAIGVLALGAMAIWQFYLFATFKGSQGIEDPQGGTHHFWWGLGAALLACIIGFFVFSVFLRYDKDNELHITSGASAH
ncbi:MAG TPA: hypothetical protein VF791_13540 [Pyrinomonadaceae bacterium]